MEFKSFCRDIVEILDGKTPKKADFYISAVENLSAWAPGVLRGIYFLDALGFYKKVLLHLDNTANEDALAFNKDFQSILTSHKDNTFMLENSEVFSKNKYISSGFTLVSKLKIKGSLFGFFFFSQNEKYNEEQIAATGALSSVYSYLIKDYELSGVFKFQLNALQDAFREKEEAYKVIEKQHKKLLELDKVKNNFLANISHELRTPLNAILGFSQALDARIFGELNEKQGEYIKDIYTSGLHLLDMINELLDITKIESKAMKVNLSEMSSKMAVEEVVNILKPLSDKKSINIVFENNCNKNIMADYQKFRQILYNLLSNAIKFTQSKGEVVVRTFCADKDFVLEIEDNGLGIETKNHKKIFTKFVHLTNAYSGNEPSTGLGLAIVKELVKLHKGKVTLKSELNKGSLFRVEFPGAVL